MGAANGKVPASTAPAPAPTPQQAPAPKQVAVEDHSPLPAAPTDPTFQRIENEAVRSILPHGLLDERGQDLKQGLDRCLSKNNWYFTAAGLVLGGGASFSSGNLKPLAVAAIVAPALDWAYSREVCTEAQAAFEDHKRALIKRQQQSVDDVRRDLREQFSADASAQQQQQHTR